MVWVGVDVGVGSWCGVRTCASVDRTPVAVAVTEAVASLKMTPL